MTVDTRPPSGTIGLTPAQCAALGADTADGSDRVALVAVHPGEPDLDALTQALMELRRRHDVLRTTVRYTDDGPVGTVGTRTVVPVELVAERPPHPADGFPPKRFDLANGPLMHVALSGGDGGRTFLGFQAHPVALDEEAMRRAVHELGLLYRYFASDGPIPTVTRVGYREHAAGVRSTTGRVPRRMPVVSHEIGPATAEPRSPDCVVARAAGGPARARCLDHGRRGDIRSGHRTGRDVPPGPVGRRPLGPACDRILLRADAGSACDIVALAEHLHAATGYAEPDDGGTPVTFTFDDDRAGAGAGPFEVVETGTVLAPSEVSLATLGTPAAGWLLRLAHRADIAGCKADRATLARAAALLEDAGASLVDEELL